MNALKIGILFGWLGLVGLGLALSTTGVATEPGTPEVSAPPPIAITAVGTIRLTAMESENQKPSIQIVDVEHGLLVVDPVGIGGELALHEGKNVSVTGIVARGQDGERVLTVSSFRILGGS